MKLLGKFRILTKILTIIALLSAVAAGITLLGVSSLKSLSDATDQMERVAGQALLAQRLSANLLAMNRAEFQISTDPRADNKKVAREAIDLESKLFNERLQSLKDRTVRPERKQIVAQLDSDWQTYQRELGGTFRAADAVTDVKFSAEMDKLRQEAIASSQLANKVRTQLRTLSDTLDEEVRTVSAAATDEYLRVSKVMMIAATIGIVFGVSFGFLITQAGITKPLRTLVNLLQRMAKGEQVEITGTDRKDEVGETGRAVNDIKTMIEEQARIEAAEKADRDLKEAAAKAERERIAAEEKAEQDRQAAAARDAALAKVMSEFDAAVGGIAKSAMAGDFSQRVSLEGKDGVIRNLAETMNIMCDNIGRVLDDLVNMLGSLADGDLSKRINANYEGTFGALKDSANTTANRLSQTISEIKSAAMEVSNAAAEISTSTTDLSQRTEEQAAGLEETSSSMEQISVTVKKNAENAQQANQLTMSTQEVANRGGAVVQEAVGAMSRIEESSRKIADIIGVIDEIARQTNLLALNAAVEAARAGDAGRGFAVVASEVRSLAQRSSQAAKDIKDLITSSSSQVQDGVELVNRAGTSLTEIVESIKKVSEIVGDIATGSAEQATGLDQINKALSQMDEVTQQNSALVEENAATAKTLEAQSSAMDERVSVFRIDEAAASQQRSAAPKPVARPAARSRTTPVARNPVAQMRTTVATAFKDDDF